MKVYVVEDYDGADSVWSTREAAEARRDEMVMAGVSEYDVDAGPDNDEDDRPPLRSV